LRKWFEKWFEKLDTRGGGGFEEYSIAWFEEYSIAWFENIVLNLLDEFIGQPPFGTEGRCSPFGGVFCVKREMSRIMVYECV
jgi:hypothetical protein